MLIDANLIFYCSAVLPYSTIFFLHFFFFVCVSKVRYARVVDARHSHAFLFCRSCRLEAIQSAQHRCCWCQQEWVEGGGDSPSSTLGTGDSDSSVVCYCTSALSFLLIIVCLFVFAFMSGQLGGDSAHHRWSIDGCCWCRLATRQFSSRTLGIGTDNSVVCYCTTEIRSFLADYFFAIFLFC